MIGLLNTRIYCCNPGHTAFIRALSTSQLKEYYDALKVEKSSTPKEIKESFLKLSKIYHPDNKKTGSHIKFVELKEAYDAIKDGPPKTTPSNKSSYYHNPQDYDLSHKGHARYRQQERDYTRYESQDYGFGGPYARSQKPWEELMRDRAFRRQQESGGFESRGGKPLAHLTLFLGAIAWIVIYSSILLVWDYNDNIKDSYTKHRTRHKDEYMSFDNYLKRREAARRNGLSHYEYRPMEERPQTTKPKKPETTSEQITPNNSEEMPLVSPTH